MHPGDDALRALIDQEVDRGLEENIRQHLAGCAACQGRLARIQAAASLAQARMSTLAPAPAEQPEAPQPAYARLVRQSQKAFARKESRIMLTRRPLWTALAVITILALVFTLTPASAWASSLLGLFRVQKITVIQFDPDATSEDMLHNNREAIKQVLQENLTVEEGGETQPFETVEDAAAAAGFTPRLPADLADARFAVQPGMRAVLTIEQETMQALLDLTEVIYVIPPEVDGEKVTIEAQSAVLAGYGCQPGERDTTPESDCVVLVQLPSPTVEAPEGLSIPRLGEAMLQFLGFSQAEARAISRRIDWTTTLILPIPQGENLAYQEVRVDGVSGTLVQDQASGSYALLWVKDGFLYGLTGTGSAEDALSIAGSIR